MVYFYDSYSSLKPIDVEFMRRLHTKVNLIPVIAKADTLTDEEIVDFKQRVRADAIPSALPFSVLTENSSDSLRYRFP
jgi:septin family protein